MMDCAALSTWFFETSVYQNNYINGLTEYLVKLFSPI